MSDASANPDDFCYRHPDRRSYILCQRCGRTICPECQTQAAVGFHCPECVKESRASAPRQRPILVRSARRFQMNGGPVATYGLMGASALVFLINLVTGSALSGYLAYQPYFTFERPWTLITPIFVQGSIIGILLHLLVLFLFGRMLEQLIGSWRFLALYLLTAFAGSVAVLLTNPTGIVIGSGAAFLGLIAALFTIQRGLGGNSLALVIIVVLNLTIAIIAGSAWQAYIGGLLVGGLVGYIYVRTRARAQLRSQQLLLGAVAAGLVVLTVFGVGILA